MYFLVLFGKVSQVAIQLALNPAAHDDSSGHIALHYTPKMSNNYGGLSGHSLRLQNL